MAVDGWKLTNCEACGFEQAIGPDREADGFICARCMRRYPVWLLIAATSGEGRYALGLSTGVEIHFTGAEILRDAQYVRLYMRESFGTSADNDEWMKLPRGEREVDVRLSEIVWVCQR